MVCPHCEEPVLAGEAAPALPNMQNFHRECVIRMVIGSVAHQQGTCTCKGGTDSDDDEPGVSRREAAKRAAAYHDTDTDRDLARVMRRSLQEYLAEATMLVWQLQRMTTDGSSGPQDLLREATRFRRLADVIVGQTARWELMEKEGLGRG